MRNEDLFVSNFAQLGTLRSQLIYLSTRTVCEPTKLHGR